MKPRPIVRGFHRQAFSNSRLVEKGTTLGFVLAQALMHQSLRVVPSRKLFTVSDSLADFYRRLPLPKISAAWLIDRSSQAAALNPLGVECVAESILLSSTLRANGHPAVLRVGVRNILGQVEAHMWVELDGEIVAPETLDNETWEVFEEAWSKPLG